MEQLTRTCMVKQVKQIMMAAGETTGKVCIVTPPYSPHRRDRAPRQLYAELLLAWVT